MSRRSCCNNAAGFTLIEVLVALAIVAAMLASIGAVIASSVRSTRTIDQKLALAGIAETVLATLPPRNLLKPGRQSGETAGHRWRIDVAPMGIPAVEGAQEPRWTPLAVTLRLQAPGGAFTQITTARLVPRFAD